MKEPEIVVLSGENRLDQYGNFFFKDKTGKEYKIGAKRKDKDQIASFVAANANRGVTLIWDVYTRDGTKYDIIKNMEPVESGLPEPVPATSVSHPEVPKIDPPPSKSREDGMREGMWYKELGSRISDGSIERDFPKSHVYIKSQYYKEMSDVTGVDFTVKQKEE